MLTFFCEKSNITYLFLICFYYLTRRFNWKLEFWGEKPIPLVSEMDILLWFNRQILVDFPLDTCRGEKSKLHHSNFVVKIPQMSTCPNSAEGDAGAIQKQKAQNKKNYIPTLETLLLETEMLALVLVLVKVIPLLPCHFKNTGIPKCFWASSSAGTINTLCWSCARQMAAHQRRS